MGLSAQWMLVRGGGIPADAGVEAEEKLDGGWCRALLSEPLDEDGLVRLARDAVSGGGETAVAIAVVDSAFALLAGAAAGIEPFSLVINPKKAAAQGTKASEQARKSGLEGLCAWAERSVSKEPDRAALEEAAAQVWEPAEEGLDEVGALIGLDLNFPQSFETTEAASEGPVLSAEDEKLIRAYLRAEGGFLEGSPGEGMSESGIERALGAIEATRKPGPMLIAAQAWRDSGAGGET
jgi:hypothetical protein